MQLVPGTNGGISFMLKPAAEKKYDYWIYICPKDVQFSTKQAVKSLRDTSARDAMPWGTIELDGTPIIDQLISSVLAGRHGLPSEVTAYIRDILSLSNHAEARLAEYKALASTTKVLYETN
jgi:hypothetical protein